MPNSLARLSLANELHQNFVLERFCEEAQKLRHRVRFGGLMDRRAQ